MRYVLGLDLGQSQDYTALIIVEQHDTAQKSRHLRKYERAMPVRLSDPPVEKPSYQVRHIERFPLGTSYPEVVRAVGDLIQRLPNNVEHHLIVDATGCGRPVVDMLDDAKLNPISVSIHGGDTVTSEGRHWRTPKRDLVGVLQVLLQSQRLKIAEALPLAPVLVQELLNFRVKIDPATAHDSYAAWREGQHDDLVLATALACWWGEQYKPVPLVGPVIIKVLGY